MWPTPLFPERRRGVVDHEGPTWADTKNANGALVANPKVPLPSYVYICQWLNPFPKHGVIAAHRHAPVNG